MNKFLNTTKCRLCSTEIKATSEEDHNTPTYCERCKPKEIDIIIYQKEECIDGTFNCTPISLTEKQRKEIIKIIK